MPLICIYQNDIHKGTKITDIGKITKELRYLECKIKSIMILIVSCYSFARCSVILFMAYLIKASLN